MLSEKGKGCQTVSARKGEKKMQEKVETALGKIRPSLQADGGGVELVEVTPDGL